MVEKTQAEKLLDMLVERFDKIEWKNAGWELAGIIGPVHLRFLKSTYLLVGTGGNEIAITNDSLHSVGELSKLTDLYERGKGALWQATASDIVAELQKT